MSNVFPSPQAAPTAADPCCADRSGWVLAGWLLCGICDELRSPTGRRVPLTTTEARLLRAMARSPQQVFSRESLLDQVRDAEAAVFDRSIDSHVSRLRRKLAADPLAPPLLMTVWGRGYRLAAEAGTP